MIGGNAIGLQMRKNPAKVTGKFPRACVRVSPAHLFCAARGPAADRHKMLHSFFIAPILNRRSRHSIAG
jgi:hypothetical protein